MAALLGLAIEEAPHAVRQDDVRRHIVSLFEGATFDVAATAPVFDNAGVARRTMALPIEAYTAELTPGRHGRRIHQTIQSIC